MNRRLFSILFHGLLFYGIYRLTFHYRSSLSFERLAPLASSYDEIRALATLAVMAAMFVAIVWIIVAPEPEAAGGFEADDGEGEQDEAHALAEPDPREAGPGYEGGDGPPEHRGDGERRRL